MLDAHLSRFPAFVLCLIIFVADVQCFAQEQQCKGNACGDVRAYFDGCYKAQNRNKSRAILVNFGNHQMRVEPGETKIAFVGTPQHPVCLTRFIGDTTAVYADGRPASTTSAPPPPAHPPAVLTLRKFRATPMGCQDRLVKVTSGHYGTDPWTRNDPTFNPGADWMDNDYAINIIDKSGETWLGTKGEANADCKYPTSTQACLVGAWVDTMYDTHTALSIAFDGTALRITGNDGKLFATAGASEGRNRWTGEAQVGLSPLLVNTAVELTAFSCNDVQVFVGDLSEKPWFTGIRGTGDRYYLVRK